MRKTVVGITLLIATVTVVGATGTAEAPGVISGWEHLSRYDGGLGPETGQRVAFVAGRDRLFIAHGAAGAIDIVDIADPAEPRLLRRVDLSRFGAVVRDVARAGELVVVAVTAGAVGEPGRVLLMSLDGDVQAEYPTGADPGMVAVSPDGNRILTADEGIPSDDYRRDPEGSVTIVDIGAGPADGMVRQVGFRRFNDRRDVLLAAGVRVYGPAATVAQDLEPEHIAVSRDGRTAWVTLQENNAVAEIDIAAASVTAIHALGAGDHSLPVNRLDPSDRDGGIVFRTGNVRGLYQPAAIIRLARSGRDYLFTANQGAPRTYGGYNEAVRIADLALDRSAYPDPAAYRDAAVFGRLHVSIAAGDPDGDGDIDQIYSFGARSVGVWRPDSTGLRLVGDTGATIETVLARRTPTGFNAAAGRRSAFDRRSDDRGPEPVALAGATILDRSYVFVGLEQALGGIMVFDVSVPARPVFTDYILTNDGSGDGTNDLAPASLVFVAAADSPTGAPLLMAGYRASGTVSIYGLAVTPR